MTTTTRLTNRRRALRLAMALTLCCTVGLPLHRSAAADGAPLPEGSGVLEARRADGTSLGPCPLNHTDVAAELSGFVARVVVTQTFANRFTEPVEAVYTFPLSDRAAVDGMTMRTGDRVIRGEIKRREDARRIYEAARARRPARRPARSGAPERLHPVARQPDARRRGADSARVRRDA